MVAGLARRIVRTYHIGVPGAPRTPLARHRTVVPPVRLVPCSPRTRVRRAARIRGLSKPSTVDECPDVERRMAGTKDNRRPDGRNDVETETGSAVEQTQRKGATWRVTSW
jgi:hypothetical protein